MKTKTHLFSHVSLLVGASFLTQCQKDKAPRDAAPQVQPVASSAGPAPARASTVTDSAGPAATAEPGLPAADAGVGDWIESTAYKFKVTSIRRCADPEAPRTSSTDASTPAEDRPIRVGVTVHILANYDELFAAARDVTIEKGGVIIRSEVNPKPSSGCSALLQPRTLRHDQVASGVVIFQLPDESYARSGIVAFQPTRWGGAPRVELKITESKLTLPKASAGAARSRK